MLLDRKRVNFWAKIVAVLIVFAFVAAAILQWGAGLMFSSKSSIPNQVDTVTLLKQNIRGNPKDIDSIIKLASIYQEKKNLLASEKLLLQGLKANPGNDKLETAIGSLYLISQKPAKSAPHFLNAIKTDPSSPIAYLGLAYSYEMFGKKNLARNTLETFLKDNPKSSYAETMRKEIERLNQNG